MSGYEVNLDYLATKVGELKAASHAVESAAGALDGCGTGDLGPGDIGPALAELADQWRYGVKEMGERVGRMAESVSAVMDNYAEVEAVAARGFTLGHPQ